MSKYATYHLYQELKDIAVNDATVHMYLKTQQNSGSSDIETAIDLIRALSKEKKQYFDMAINAENMSIRPMLLNRGDL